MTEELKAAKAALAIQMVDCRAVRNAVDHNGGKPWTLASGRTSAVYCNCRGPVSSSVEAYRLAVQAYLSVAADVEFDLIIGVATAGIAWAGAVGYGGGYPFGFWRKEKKDHGVATKVEAEFRQDDVVVVFDDVLTTGGSIADAVLDMRERGLVVPEAVVLVDRQEGGVESLANYEVKLHAVLTLDEILAVVKATPGAWSEDGIAAVEAERVETRKRYPL